MTSTAVVIVVLLVSLALIAAAPAQTAPLLHPTELRCEYRANPRGIDVTEPRLTWLLKSDDPGVRGQRQSAYQILVASSPEKLTEAGADLWNTGKVNSDRTAQIVYEGKPLASRQRCYWSVRTWNAKGDASPWSKSAMWTMGLLNESEWQAKWIGYDAPAAADDAPAESIALADAKWIWAEPMDKPTDPTPLARAWFRRAVEIPGDARIASANIVITADDGFVLLINGQRAGQGGAWNRAFHFDIAPFLKPGRNIFAIEVRNGANSPAGLVLRARIETRDGDTITVESDASWKSAKEPHAGWDELSFDDSAWARASAIATVGDAPWGVPPPRRLVLPPSKYLRTTFDADKPIRRATIYATALGCYELRLNGQRVGDVELAPGWTDYNKRVYYHAYDVTDIVKSGRNALAGILADGWFAGYLGYTFKRENYSGQPRLLAQLEVEYADGSTQIIATDESWRASHGPLREADLLMGCTYDARLEMPGWDTVSFDDSSWSAVNTGIVKQVLVQAHPGDPVRRIEEIPAKTVSQPTPGSYVFDLGQNMVGWARFRYNAKAGHRYVFRFAEMLNPDGTLYTVALRDARATNTYIAARDGEVVWEPQFTFHGFQYVEIQGLDDEPTTDAVTGIVVHSDIQQSGSFESSHALLNQLFHNIIWGQKGNYLEIPTDCPQRDERLGWTGDAQFFMLTGTYNFDVGAFFTKWLVDLIDDSQMESGGFTHVAPALNYNDGGATAWQDAAVICTWVIYRMYDDTRIIEHHYPRLVRFMEYLHNTSNNFIRNEKPFGDWLNLGGGAKGEVIGTAYYAYIAQLMSDMASAIGKEDDARKYAELASQVRDVFVREFLKEDGSILESSQTGYALAFTMELIPRELRAKAADRFVEEIAKKDWHLATGFIGTPRLLPALTHASRIDVAYRLLLNESFPSWLYPVTLGATTMWERWDGWRPETGFQDPGMNSFNHYAFGSVGEWLYHTAAGINMGGEPGFKTFELSPRPGGSLQHLRASYRSINGLIESGWRVESNGIVYDFTIPPNTTATLHLIASDPETVREGDVAASNAAGVRFIRREGSRAVYELQSGKYRFLVPH